MKSNQFTLLLSSFLGIISCCCSLQSDEEDGREFLNWRNKRLSELCTQSMLASWEFSTNITDENLRKSISVDMAKAKFEKEVWGNISNFDWENFEDPLLRREFKLISVLGILALDEDKLAQYKNLTASMESIYGSTKICSHNDSSECNLNLEPEISDIMAKSRNYDELLDAWQQWHVNVGRKCKSHFAAYVELGNEAAKLNSKQDLGDLWRYEYEDDEFESTIAEIWQKLKPLYQQLHAYVRKKLAEYYGEDKVCRTGPIPAHILGNMWAQQWSSLYDLVTPFKNVSLTNFNAELEKQNYTVNKIVHLADDFFASLGMERVPELFWNKSVFVRPDDGRDIVCHASAWDFCTKEDFRIKMCAEVNSDSFVVTHHEMGHIQYYMQYKDQPITFREGANPGFHEAIGDVVALSAVSNNHLRLLNLYDGNDSKEADINFLLYTALDKLAFLPFGYAVDVWRWKVFRNEIPESDWNSEWWNIRKELQGITPAIPRSPLDFDAAAKYHVAADVEYARYFVAAIIQYQFHLELCTLAGQYNATDPKKHLHHCDIYQNKEAGQHFAEVLKLGRSKPWPEIMKMFTCEDKMNPDALLEFYKPLMEFLVEDNIRTGEKIGWD